MKKQGTSLKKIDFKKSLHKSVSKLKQTAKNISTLIKKNPLLSLDVALLSITFVALLFYLSYLAQKINNGLLLDFHFGFSATTANTFISNLSPIGVENYHKFHKFETYFILTAMALFSFLIYVLAKKQSKEAKNLIFIPLAAGLFDLIENFAIENMLINGLSENMLKLASFSTQVKLPLLVITIAIILMALISHIISNQEVKNKSKNSTKTKDKNKDK